MSTSKRRDGAPEDYGYQPKTEISEGYQPSEERGYQPSKSTNKKPDNPPKGTTSAQSIKNE